MYFQKRGVVSLQLPNYHHNKGPLHYHFNYISNQLREPTSPLISSNYFYYFAFHTFTEL